MESCDIFHSLFPQRNFRILRLTVIHHYLRHAAKLALDLQEHFKSAQTFPAWPHAPIARLFAKRSFANIVIIDARCARAYLDAQNDYSYVRRGCDLLEGLAKAVTFTQSAPQGIGHD